MIRQQLPLVQGNVPPQAGIPHQFENVNDMLLYTAWLHGLTPTIPVHRLALFSFVQSHIANKSDEALQGTIERSYFWRKNVDILNGFYVLNEDGLGRIAKLFHGRRDPIDFAYEYTFHRRWREEDISVIVNIARTKLTPCINGKPISGSQAVERLRNMGTYLPNTQSSNPKKILNWILQNNNYWWTAKYH